ncbi:MAG: site-specific DNA-methyltransferase [Alphaproteobacteria bacterium]|nr:site-specific DNA-methyltransferase [Alphaproteobacteria bacterium]
MTNRVKLQSNSQEFSLSPRLTLNIIYRRIEELKPDPANPRCHTKKQIRQIAGSIKAFGFNVPILVDREGNIIAGHGRYLACLLLGITEVPTLCLDHLTPEQVRAFMIADNRLSELSTWNDRLVAEQLKELSLVGLDFDIEVTGFEMGEIDLRIASLDRPPERDDDPADIVPTLADGPAVSKLGDLWRLGGHRVLCGNALDAAAFGALLAAERAAMVFTDPPYNVPIDGHASGLGAIHHRPFPMASGEMDSAQFTAFLAGAFRNLAAFSAAGALHYVCMDWRHLAELLTAARGVYGEVKNCCCWVKDAAGMGSLYRSQHELVFVFKQGRHEHRNNVQLGRFGRNRSNVWRYPGGNSFGRCTEEGNLLALHPTVKSVALVADAILDCSARGEIVLDPFLGSGTTVIAAERTGRRCCGLELDPRYVDTILRRWQKLTGGSAHHAASGRSFDDLAREAEAANAA